MVILGETIATGAECICPDCGEVAKLDVYRSAAGYYVGTYCNCGPYSRESGYYATEEKARKAFIDGYYGR